MSSFFDRRRSEVALNDDDDDDDMRTDGDEMDDDMRTDDASDSAAPSRPERSSGVPFGLAYLARRSRVSSSGWSSRRARRADASSRRRRAKRCCLARRARRMWVVGAGRRGWIGIRRRRSILSLSSDGLEDTNEDVDDAFDGDDFWQRSHAWLLLQRLSVLVGGAVLYGFKHTPRQDGVAGSNF